MKRSLHLFRPGLLAAAFLCLGISARAVTETITSPTTIDVSDSSHDNNDLIIIGATVTINGAHPFHSLTLQSGAVINHTAALAAGMKLTVAQNITIDGSSKMDVSGQGYGNGAGPGAGTTASVYGGGGGYGGNGANYGGAVGGSGYGSLLQPTDLGSGGGSGAYNAGGAGGGSIRLIVGGTLQLDGSLAASGAVTSQPYGGGGSGGSVYVTAGTLAGSGTIAANGGDWSNNGSGAGGGGRIALYATSSSFPLTNVSATGGGGNAIGGAGTIYTQFGSQTIGNLVIANRGAGANTNLTGVSTVANLTVTGGAVAAFDGTTVNQDVVVNGATLASKSGVLNVTGNISLSNGSLLRPEVLPSAQTASVSNLTLHVTGSCSVDSSSAISATGYGYGGGAGPGAGTTASVYGGGGGYGGNGANYGGAVGGSGYGSLLQPTDLGSGGGAGAYNAGGAGGGSIRLIVGGTLQVDGSLAANGNGGGTYGGGGSGGSVYVTAGTLAGAGTISANGGDWSNNGSGAGGGGRIALYASSSSFPLANVSATGGGGNAIGGAGTIYTQFGSQSVGNLIIANRGAGANTDLSQTANITNLSVLSGAVALYGGAVNGPLTIDGGSVLLLLPVGVQVAGNVSLTTNSAIRPFAAPLATDASQPNLLLTVAGNLTEDANSAISATGYGYGGGAGPGAGTTASVYGGGGGYGGNGANYSTATGGGTYGSLTAPLDLGSGGGLGAYNGGGAGGGSIRLIVGGTLQLDGSLAASGAVTSQPYGGGGSGGSVYVTAGTLAGSGTISANGGDWSNNGSGAGGGGRIAIYTIANNFPAGSVSVNGGNGNAPGAVGTIYYGVYNPSAPTTMITSGPAENSVVPSGVVTFTYTGSSQVTLTASLHYKYRLDGGAWQGPTLATTASLTGLSDGPHTFYVAAIDGLGAADTAPPSRDFIIDNPPVFSQIAAAAADAKVAITWTSDKPADSKVLYRVTGQTAWQTTLNQTALVTAHSVVISGLLPNTNYEYEVASADTYHTAATSGVNTFKTKVDTTPPATTITGGPTEGMALGVSTVTFTFTGTDNVSAAANLKYQYKVDGGSYSAPSALTTATLTGLPDGQHTFTVAAIDEAGNVDANPPVRHFSTDATLPTISNVQTGGATDSAIGFGWDTNKPTTSQVKYRIAGAAAFDMTNEDTNYVTTHRVSLYNLKPNKTYQFYVVSRDSFGRMADTSASLGTFQTLPDTTPPQTAFTISPANGGLVQPGNIVFAWTGADDASPVAALTYQYQLDGGAWTPSAPSPATTVTIALPNPQPNTHTLRVRAYDETGNVDPNPPSVTFTVDGTQPVFSALNASNLTFNSAQINWTTNKATTGQAQYDTGTGNFDFHFDYNASAINHSLIIGPLGSNTSYRVRILAKDAAGNMATSPTLTFTTAKLHDLSVSNSAITFSDPGPASGDRITMTAKIHNAGDFNETATVVFYDSTPTDGNIEVGRAVVSAPSRAEADAVAVSPSFVVLEGPHKPFVQIVNASPAEDITSNNAAGTDLTVGAPACRFAFGVSTPTTFPGDDSLFAVNITNTGSKPQTLSNVALTGTAWVNLASAIPATPINPGQSAQLTYRMTPPTSQAGGGLNSPVVVPMTVTASCGMTFSQKFSIEVYATPVTALDITVKDALTGNPLSGATIALDNTNRQYFTGPQGKPIDNGGNPVTIYTQAGSRNVYAIASHYLPNSVNTDGTQPITLNLQPGQALQVSAVTVTEITPSEAAARGVNLTDPANTGVFDFTLSMKIGPLPVPNIILPTTPVAAGTTVTQTFDIPQGFGGGGGGGGGGGYGGGYGGGVGTLTVYYPTPDPTIHTDTWIIIPGEIRFLKQFFDATVFVKNNSSYPINNAQASLALPNGVSFPDLFGSPQQISQSLGTIAAQGQAAGNWVLRGDLAGDYKVTGSATGVIALGGSNVNLNSSLQSGTFTVAEPKISVQFGTPSVVHAGQPFDITIAITNQSTIDLNGVQVKIKSDKLTNCHLAPGQMNPLPVGTIAKGDTQTVTFTFISEVTGVVEQVNSYVSPSSIEPPVTVTPKPVLPPVARADSLNTLVNSPYTINVLANDSDPNSPALPLTLTTLTQPAHGTVSKNADNTLTYVPNAGYDGADNFTYTISNGDATATAEVAVRVRAVTSVSGTVHLEGTASAAHNLTLKFRPTDGGIAMTRTVMLDTNGSFSLNGIPAGTYSLAIKGYKWLQVAVPIDTNAGAVFNVSAALQGGDANDDNSVDTTDFGILVGAYGSDASVPGSGYDIHADFNDDGFVDTTDFGILVGNYGQSGAK